MSESKTLRGEDENDRTFDFGVALMWLKAGSRVQRAGWNGKGMYLYLQVWHDAHFEPCIVMFTAQGLHQPGWLASQADMLANDWAVVEVAQ